MKKTLALILAMAVLVMSIPVMTVVAAETDAEGYTLIETAADFELIRENPAGKYKLVADITLPDDYEPFAFSGILIGDDEETLKSIKVNIGVEDSENLWGLFTIVSGAFQIKNIILKGSVTGADGDGSSFFGYLGGFAAMTSSLEEGAIIENCVNEATITNNGTMPQGTGGFIGMDRNETHYLTLKNLTNKGAVTTTSRNNGGMAGTFSGHALYCSNFAAISGAHGTATSGSGGIVGNAEGAVIDQCFNTASVSDTNAAGGIVGIVNFEQNTKTNGVTITNCYNTAVHRATNTAACAILGASNNPNNATLVENCYTSVISQTRPVAYITNSSYSPAVENSYYLRSVASSDNDGSTHLTEAQGTVLSNFTGFSSDIWEIEAISGYSYPQLKNNRQVYSQYTEIANVNDFEAIKNDTAGLYKLVADIDLVGNYTISEFSGVLDGNGYSINVTDATAPLIDALTGTLKNLTITGTATVSVGESGVFVKTNSGIIDKCVNKAAVTLNENGAGVFVGVNYGTIINCENHGDVTIPKATAGHGGIVGVSRSGIAIENCANYGNIVSKSSAYNIGGIVGEIRSNTFTALKNCLNAGNISCNEYTVGGLFPAFLHSSYINIKFENCYNSGIITVAGADYTTEYGIYANNNIGVTGTVFENCYCIISGTTTAKSGITALTADEMKNPAKFVGFDFEKVWKMPDANKLYKYPQHIGSTYEIEIKKGTEENPYLIPDDVKFSEISAAEGVYYKLADNIKLSGNYTIASFAGVLDGDGYTITIEDGTTALFGTLASSAVVENFNIEGKVAAQAVVANVNNGKINKVKNYASFTATKSYGGVFAGELNSTGSVTNCGNFADITTSASLNNLGGIAGYLYYGKIENCVNQGNIISKGNAEYIGGIVGQLRSKNAVVINNCMNAGDITTAAGTRIGGIIGSIPLADYVGVVIKNSYNAGKISASGAEVTNANAIYGENIATDTEISSCYYLIYGTSEGKAGNGKTAEDLKEQSTFDGWEFSNTAWLMPGADKIYKYPQLAGLTFDVNAGETKEFPYEIDSAADFKAVSTDSKKLFYKLTGNIELTGDYAISNFSGDLDGNGKTITVTNGTTAIFAETTATAEIYNLTLRGNLTISEETEAVLAKINYGIISDCKNYATLIADGKELNDCGVFAGQSQGTITGCVNYADLVFSGARCGGIVGDNNGGVVSDCGNYGDINKGSSIAGVVGQHSGGKLVSGCYNTGTITGDDEVGGIIGRMLHNDTKVENCYNAGNAVAYGGKTAGGIVAAIGHPGRGESNPYTGNSITNCYNAGAIMCGEINETEDWAIFGKIINNSANPAISGCAYLAAENIEKEGIQGLAGNDFNAKVADFNITLCGINEVDAPTLYEVYGDEADESINVFSASEYLTTAEQFKLLNKYTLLSFANANFGKMGWALGKVGFIVSKADSNDVKDVAIETTNALGDFSMLVYGGYITGGEYNITPYAEYTRVGYGEEKQRVTGETVTIDAYIAMP